MHSHSIISWAIGFATLVHREKWTGRAGSESGTPHARQKQAADQARAERTANKAGGTTRS